MLNILLVEDERTIGEGTKTLLEMQEDKHFCVTWIERGDTAKEILAKSHDFQCILMDLSLPGVPGIEVVEHLRQWDKKTPVIVTTARRCESRMLRCWR